MNEELIKETLYKYGFKDIVEIKVLRDKPDRNKIIRCDCKNKVYIMKIYCDGWTTAEKINKQGIINNFFVENGMPFATIFKVRGQYYNNITIDDVEYKFSLEEFIYGKEPEKITDKMSKQMATLLAKQHILSEKSGFRFGYDSCWSLFSENLVTNDLCPENYEFFLKFIENATKYKYDEALINKIKITYNDKRNALLQIWDKLPSGPIQGDWGEYNMVIDDEENIIGIYDFNISGDEVFINEFASIVSWNVEDIQGFIKNYTSIRPFTELEKEAYPIIMQIVKPFKFYRVEHIVNLMQDNKQVEVMEFIEETLTLLNKKYELCKSIVCRQ